MKKFRLFGMVLITILMCACYACSNGSEEIETPQKPKMVTVKFDVKNIVSVTEMPMGNRAGGTNNDLYQIEIQKTDGTVYAVGLFDLSETITATLPEGEEFWFRGVAVKDAKEKILQSNDGMYCPPFFAKLTNKFTTEIHDSYRFYPERFILKANTENGYEDAAIAKDLEVYYLHSNYNSSSKTYKVSDDNDDLITFSPNRILYIGTEFKAEDMPEGKLYVSFSAEGIDGNTYTSTEIEVVNEDTPVFNTFSFNDLFADRIHGSGLELTLHMKWVKADGTEVILPNSNAKITVKYGHKYVITISVDNTSTAQMRVDKIVTPTFDDYNTEKWNIDKGNATKQ